MLFTPPFDNSPLDPGDIKSYVPGVRENGGQYPHGAFWTVIAYSLLEDGRRAGELFALLNSVNHAPTRAGRRLAQEGRYGSHTAMAEHF